jgi:tetratricopeptide (TPR) repeat protein
MLKIKYSVLIFILISNIIVYSQQTTNPEDDILTNAAKGSLAYLKSDYKKAIKYYSKTLELYDQQSVLDTTFWRVIVDNLGMSYGLTGKHKKAIEIFRMGISKDIEYPMFYYNLACAYAELDSLESSIKNLKLAYKFKDNMIKGESMPYAEKDDSFKKYLNNKVFLDSLRAIYNSIR